LLADDVQVPSDLLTSLKTNLNVSVKQFIQTELAPRSGSQRALLTLTEWFAADAINFIPKSIPDLLLPSAQVCENLDGHLQPALDSGCISVRHPEQDDIFLPLWVSRAWKWANVQQSKLAFWKEKLAWIQTAAKEESWPRKLLSAAEAAILESPWNAVYPKFQRTRASEVVSVSLAGLLSQKWMTDDQINCITGVICSEIPPDSRIDTSHGTLDTDRRLAANDPGS
jgi:hypothetical protein